MPFIYKNYRAFGEGAEEADEIMKDIHLRGP
jgi:hypothetical protein